MKSLRSIIVDQQSLTELGGLIEVYEEVAAGRMRRVKAEILACREYYEELSQLSFDVGADLARLASDASGLTAAVFIAANAGLYGNIVEDVFVSFLRYVRDYNARPVVIGRRGEELMGEHAPGMPYDTFPLSDEEVTHEPIHVLLQRLGSFRRIVVFYGKFRNIAIQESTQMTLSGDLASTIDDPKILRKHQFSYVYEPGVAEVSAVFATEVQSGVLEQVLRESQLAKYASRFMHLDAAIGNVHSRLGRLTLEKRSIRKTISDRKQHAMIGGVRARI